jgi:hypothetical protein
VSGEEQIMTRPDELTLEDVVVATYAALDDALQQGGIPCTQGKLIPRPGGPPEVDDREILCLALLEELFGFSSDNEFQLWLRHEPTMRSLFPRRLSRQNFADRRALLAPLLERLCGVFCDMMDGEKPPFSSSTLIPWTSVVRSGREKRSGWADSRGPGGALRCDGGITG